jgi:hypothetical protein
MEGHQRMTGRIRQGARRISEILIVVTLLIGCTVGGEQPTPTLFLIPTPIPVTPTLLEVSVLPTAECVYDAAWVSDVTIPDGMELPIDTPFIKTWQIRNTGTCAWDGAFSFVFLAGNPLGGPEAVSVPPTPAGATVNISVSLSTSGVAGSEVALWGLQTPDGKLVGEHMFVKIKVIPPPPPPTSTPGPETPTPTLEPAPPLPDILSGITSASRKIFLDGRARGNRANVFSKVGDSISFAWHFMHPIGEGLTQLHGYTFLQPIVNYYSSETARTGNSFGNDSLATLYGWTVATLLDPAKAQDGCAGRSPLVCEYELVRPAVAIIMIGTNDCTGHTTAEDFEADLRRVMDTSVGYGIIPVLSTIPWTSYCDAMIYNNVIINVAHSYDTPLLNYYSAMETLPHHGVGDDDVHPTIPPDNNTANFSADSLQYGYTLRNLTALQMLDAIWRQVLSY